MDRVKLCDQILLQKLHLLSNEVLRTNRGITERDMEEAFKQSIGYRAPRFFPQNDGILAIVYSAIYVAAIRSFAIERK